MVEACCINAYDCQGNYICTLDTLQKENIGTDICYTAPEIVGTRAFDYITYIDKCGCCCRLDGEREILINTFPGELKTFNASSTSKSIKFCWSEIFGNNRCKTIIRYKTGSYPISIEDGTLAIEETEQNTYSSTGFLLEGLTPTTTYYSKIYALDGEDNIISEKCCCIETIIPFSTVCFGYTGAEQNITLHPGTYKLEVWGAQGGYYTCVAAGGKGGYSQGCLTLTATTTLYLYVGGKGGYGITNNCIGTGGYNGGGHSCGSNRGRGAGGGATDIRIGGNTINHRRIVAGGGGGSVGKSECMATEYETTAYGGGTTGGSSTCCTGTGQGGGSGGCQTAGGKNTCITNSGAQGTFGAGGDGMCGGTMAGGGGGWYGGAAGSGAGGGSGYIYNSSTCGNTPSSYCHNTAYFLTNAYTCCGGCSFPTPAGGTETGHSGNGCIKISFVQ